MHVDAKGVSRFCPTNASLWRIAVSCLSVVIMAEAVRGEDFDDSHVQMAFETFLPTLRHPALRESNGLSAEDDPDALVPGTPFATLILDTEKLEALDKPLEEIRLEDVAHDGTTIYIPINLGDQPRALMTISRGQGGEWIADSVGMGELARVWGAVTEAWPSADGYQPKLVIVPGRLQFFFTVPEAPSGPNLTRLPGVGDIAHSGVPSAESFATLTPLSDSLHILKTPTTQ